MIVYGADNRILLRVYFAYWSSKDLHQLKIAIGKSPSDMFPVPVSQRDFNREFPVGGSLIARHPNISGIVGALLITAIICLGIAAVQGDI